MDDCETAIELYSEIFHTDGNDSMNERFDGCVFDELVAGVSMISFEREEKWRVKSCFRARIALIGKIRSFRNRDGLIIDLSS